MKKFKVKKKRKYLIFLIIIGLILFIWLSFLKLEKSYSKIINYLLYDSHISREKPSKKYTLDYFIPDYYFKEKEKNYLYYNNFDK